MDNDLHGRIDKNNDIRLFFKTFIPLRSLISMGLFFDYGPGAGFTPNRVGKKHLDGRIFYNQNNIKPGHDCPVDNH
jgi:hypothetical protein